MRPLQVMLPLIGGGLGEARARRDATRACVTWDGEARLWLMPDFPQKGVVVWREDWQGRPAILRAVAAEELNRIDIYHVGENGFVDGPPVPGRFDDLTIDGVLDAWLDWPECGTIEFQEPAPLNLEVPRFSDNEVSYEGWEIDPVPLVTMPVQKTEDGPPTFRVPGQSQQPVSPESELAEAYEAALGRLTGRVVDGTTLVTSEKDPEFISRGATLRAAPPLEGLFSTGVNLDALFHWTRMSSVIRESRSDLKGALKRARNLSSDYVTEGQSDLGHCWFLPTLAEVKDVDLVIQRAETYRLTDARTWDEVAKSPEWRNTMTSPIPIRRVWGPIGFFWALVLDRLENAQPQVFCERCGMIIEAKTRRKKFCSREENEECFLARRAADRRRGRAR